MVGIKGETKFTYGGTALYFFGDSTGFFSVSESLLLSSELDLGLNSAFLGTGAEGFAVAAGLTFFSDSESLLSSELDSSFLVGGLKVGSVKYNLYPCFSHLFHLHTFNFKKYK